jgi:integrase
MTKAVNPRDTFMDSRSGTVHSSAPRPFSGNDQFPWCEHVIFHHDASRSNRAIPGNPLVSVRRAWNSAVKRAGYPGLLLHDMRRTACRNMVQEAKIPRALAKLISGHLTDSMFERYNIVDPEDVTSIGQDIEKWMIGAVESVEPPKVEV